MQSTKATRRQRILHLIETREVHSQSELAEWLAAEDLAVNQATLSRDLRDLGVLKGPAGYALPGAPAPVSAAGAEERLVEALGQWLARATRVQHQLVLHTPASGAQPLAHAIDHAGLPEVVGTLAGDDTILVITPDAGAAKRLLARFTREVPSAAQASVGQGATA